MPFRKRQSQTLRAEARTNSSIASADVVPSLGTGGTAMHPNIELISRLYRSLAAHDHKTMAECYHQDATFEDIAFKLEGREKIHGMWRFVTRPEPKLTVTFSDVTADDYNGRAKLIDDYVFTETGRPVHNVITSIFRFRGGLIASHRDECDPIAWANMAMTGPKAWLAGHVRPIRARAAAKKLDQFLTANTG